MLLPLWWHHFSASEPRLKARCPLTARRSRCTTQPFPEWVAPGTRGLSLTMRDRMCPRAFGRGAGIEPCPPAARSGLPCPKSLLQPGEQLGPGFPLGKPFDFEQLGPQTAKLIDTA